MKTTNAEQKSASDRWFPACRRVGQGLLAALAIALASQVGLADPSALTATTTTYYHPQQSTNGASQAAAALPSLPLHAHASSPLTFNFVPVGNLADMFSGTPDQQAFAGNVLSGFQQAGDLWRHHFTDPITINLAIDFGPQGDNILGGTSSQTHIAPYFSSGGPDDVAIAMANDRKSPDDFAAVSHFQGRFNTGLDIMTNYTTVLGEAPRVRDFDNGNNNRWLDVNRANAKALGLLSPVDPGLDALVTFTDFSDFTFSGLGWDFDRTDGISPQEFDFVGMAAHEIAHAMGFRSGVDTVDLLSDPNGPQGPTARAGNLPPNNVPIDLNNYVIFSTLDLFRYSANSLSQPAQPSTVFGVPGAGVLDLSWGEATPGDTPYFSIDGGATNLGTFSTGRYNGDGWQASHWQFGAGLGLMGPTVSPGQLRLPSMLDLRALDVIGYDLVRVPEPTGVVLIAGALAMFALSRRKGVTVALQPTEAE